MSRRDLYEVLEVDRGDSAEVIKKAYRKLALKNHPDRNPGDDEARERFKEAAEAYDILRDDQKRAIYDQYGHAGLERQGHSGFEDMGDIFSNLGGIFEDIFGLGGRRGGRGRGPARGEDLGLSIGLTLREAAEGVERSLPIDRTRPCEGCGGSGAEDASAIETCGTCGGRGQVTRAQGFMMLTTTCPDCRGAGKKVTRACEDCDGRGLLPQSETIEIAIPAGIDHGERLRVRGAGNLGPAGPGDLYIEIRLQGDPDLARHGVDIHSALQLDIAEAALGCKKSIRGLLGDLDVRVPAGSQPGSTVHVAGKGMPRRGGYGRGEHVVHLEVVVPQKLNRRARKALEEYLRHQPAPEG